MTKNHPKTTPNMPIKMRPHHLLCSLCFEGKGYSPAFVKNFWHIVEQLRHDRNNENDAPVFIEIIRKNDAICKACPHQRGDICKDEGGIIKQLDDAHANALGLCEGDILSWKDAIYKIKATIDIETHYQICKACRWREFGICKKHIENLLNEE